MSATSPAKVRFMLAQLGEDERAAVKRLFVEKMMRRAKTRDLAEVIDWMGRNGIDKRAFPKVIEDVMRGRGHPPGPRRSRKLD